MTTAIHQNTTTHQSLETTAAPVPRIGEDTKMIMIMVVAAVGISALLSAVTMMVLASASPEQMEQITTMMSGYTAAL